MCVAIFKRVFYTQFKIFKRGLFLTNSGEVFHSRGAEEETKLSYIAFIDLGTAMIIII